MNSIINTKGLDISKPSDFAKFVALAQEFQGQIDAAWGLVEEQMQNRNIQKIAGDWGTISMAERKNWKATKQLPPRFYKQTLDTAKLNFLNKAGEKLPEGAEYTTTSYISKRFK